MEIEGTLRRWLAATMILGVALRVWGLGTQSMWLDELFSRRAALATTLWDSILRGSVNDMFPPLFPIISHFAVLLPGDAEAALRLPSALAGSMAVFVVFLIGRVLHSARVGLVAAALVASHWFAVAYSQEGRPYALLLLASTLTAYAGLCVVARQRRGQSARSAWCGLGISGLVLSYLHYIGVVFFALEGLLLLAWIWRDRALRKGWLWTFGLVAGAFLPWLGVVLTQIERRLSDKEVPAASGILRTYADMMVRHPIWFVLLLVLGIWAGTGDRPERVLRTESVFSARERAWMLGLWATLPVFVTFVLSHLVVPIYTPRNMIVILPAFAVLIALALVQIEQTLLRGLPLASLLLVAGLCFDLTVLKHYYGAHKEPFEQFAGQVVRSRGPDDALWVEPPRYAGFVNQYLELLGTDLRVTPPAQPAPAKLWLLTRNTEPALPPGYRVLQTWRHEPDKQGLPWAGQPMVLVRLERAP